MILPWQGQSAGSASVSVAIARHSDNPLFRAGIMFSGALTTYPATPSFTNFNLFAAAVNCTQDPGAERLRCLKSVPAAIISNYTNGPICGGSTNAPTGGNFVPVVDK
jgi:carboxylesterase type B